MTTCSRRLRIRQLESDVPLGALLSGGIDSSLVSAYSRRHIEGDLLTFNVRFPDAEYDETPAARTVAAAIGSDHQTLEMGGQSGTWEQITALMRIVGQPFADTSLFAVDQIAAAMRQQVTVALSGDGGDEGFGGYDVYWQIAAINGLRWAPASYGALVRLSSRRSPASASCGRRLRRMRELAGAGGDSILQRRCLRGSAAAHSELTRPLGGVGGCAATRPRPAHPVGRGVSPLERLSTRAPHQYVSSANDYPGRWTREA